MSSICCDYLLTLCEFGVCGTRLPCVKKRVPQTRTSHKGYGCWQPNTLVYKIKKTNKTDRRITFTEISFLISLRRSFIQSAGLSQETLRLSTLRLLGSLLGKAHRAGRSSTPETVLENLRCEQNVHRNALGTAEADNSRGGGGERITGCPVRTIYGQPLSSANLAGTFVIGQSYCGIGAPAAWGGGGGGDVMATLPYRPPASAVLFTFLSRQDSLRTNRCWPRSETVD